MNPHEQFLSIKQQIQGDPGIMGVIEDILISSQKAYDRSLGGGSIFSFYRMENIKTNQKEYQIVYDFYIRILWK